MTDDDVQDDVLDVEQTAKLLMVGRNHVYNLAARNQIPHAKVGRFLRFRKSAVMRWLESCGPQASQQGK